MFKFSRLLIAYAVAVPLALILGYLAVSPGSFTIMVVGMLLFFFSIPLLLKWHHFLLILFWNTVFNVYFLPGSPDMWLLFAAVSFLIAFVNHIIFQKSFIRAPEITRPLFFLAGLVVFVAWYRGGIGIRAFGGSTYGGRYYIFILIAIAGYFALTSERIPISKGQKIACLFLGGGLTSALSNIIYMMGSPFYFLYAFVPSGNAMVQASAEYTNALIDRIAGLGTASVAGLCCMFAAFGIRGIFDFSKPWRFVLFLTIIVASFFSGFRADIIILAMIFSIQFYLEGLVHTHLLPIVVALGICGFVPILLFSEKMPTSVQRAISFLPVNVNSDVLDDAKKSVDWRLGMWNAVVKEIPKYAIIGKGYAIDPQELFLVTEAQRTGTMINEYDGSMLAGDYHNGTLSVLIPFGIPGLFGFIWLLYGGYKVLVLNYRHGDPKLRRINTILLSYYVTMAIAFFAIFGAFNSQLYLYLGICGFSISLNGGVKRKVISSKAQPAPTTRTLALEPG